MCHAQFEICLSYRKFHAINCAVYLKGLRLLVLELHKNYLSCLGVTLFVI